jgi:hypothetical protein
VTIAPLSAFAAGFAAHSPQDTYGHRSIVPLSIGDIRRSVELALPAWVVETLQHRQLPSVRGISNISPPEPKVITESCIKNVSRNSPRRGSAHQDRSKGSGEEGAVQVKP